ncbi:RNA 3'-terminal phosphate cyclase [Haladaptatus sp. DJG-WS-42]|uniref:RNA 3'-terminal phosphate cyclase n=1 Tax=Haladaptatus sp. DJG-WS-42 TaxID=3120516 RepID=UPI0030D624D4
MRVVSGQTGGGQILRTALSLSALDGRPVTVRDIRSSRPTPGLKRQHCAVVETLAKICEATVSDVSVGTETLTFEPDVPTGGEFTVDIGTAGSLTLLFDALLPLATVIDEPLTVRATGGTDVRWAPTVAWYDQVKLPLLAHFGLDAALRLDHTGFYPSGGGEATLTLTPSTLAPITIPIRGTLNAVTISSKASTHLRKANVAERQAIEARRLLEADGHEVAAQTVSTVESASPGSSLLVRAAYDSTVVGFDALGEKGKTAENVAAAAVNTFRKFHASGATVDSFLADQLLLWLALCGGEFVAPKLSGHVETNREVISRFGYDIDVCEEETGLIRCSAPSS